MAIFWFKVEMAGLEPASERFDPRISTSVDDHLISPHADGPTYLQQASRLNPKVLFHTVNGVMVWHSDIVTPVPPPVRGRGGQTWPLEETICVLPYALGGEGHSSIVSVFGT